MDSQDFNEGMSFPELYNWYYALQMKEKEIPMMKTYIGIQEGILNKLNELSSKKLGAKKESLFLPGLNLNQISLPEKENNFEHKKEKLDEYSEQIIDSLSFIKKIIISKLEKNIDSKDFKIYLDIASKPGAHLDSESENLALKFTMLNNESALGLYYIIHNDIPLAEFFQEKYGFALKISEFPEVKEKINSIRKLAGIKNPRDLAKTIEEEGRREDNKKRQIMLDYAIKGEMVIYQFLDKYLVSNFGVTAHSDQGMTFPVGEGFLFGIFNYDNLIIQKKTCEDNSKNKWGLVWTGDLNILSSTFEKKDIKDNFILKERFISKHDQFYSPSIESFCASCIDKFSEKNLVSKLKIGMSKKYY